jgi:Rrf2 family iron-sulfur cluster assembly transcriptional regulator
VLSLSQTTGYAILALSCLRQSGGELVLAKDIAACTGIPLPYLLKLLHAMGKAGLVTAKRGYRGGFALARPADGITLRDVAQEVDGRAWLPVCLLGLEECSDQRGCPTHDFWKAQRLVIEAELQQTTVKDVADFEARRQNRLGRCGAPGVKVARRGRSARTGPAAAP